MNPSVARFDSHFSVRSTAYALPTVLKEIREGQTTVITADAIASQIGGRSLRHACDHAQSLLQNGNRDGYNVVKTSLPAIAFQGVSCEHSRAIDTLSGVVICEWDDVEDPAYALSILSQHPYVRAAWISLSGDGVKAIGSATPTPSVENYHLAWFTFASFFEDIGAVDTTGRRVNQLNALAYADRFYENVNALSFEWDAEDTAEYASQFPDAVAEDIENAALLSLPVEYQDAILEMDWNDDGWGRTRLPCLFTQHEHDGWGSRSNAMAVRRGATGDLLFRCHKCDHTRVYREKEALRNLQIDNDFQRETSTLEAERVSVRLGLEKWISETEGQTGQVLNITTAAGTGKSTTAITTASHLLHIAKTTEEADQAFSIANGLGNMAHRHRPRMFNRGHENWDTLPIGLGEHERPCVYPEVCNDLATAGHSTQVKCDGCEWRGVCESDGYLSQEKLERSHDQVFYSWDEALFSDRIHRERVQRLTDGGKLLVCDEAVPSNLPMSRCLSISELAVLSERWRLFSEQSDLYFFLKKLNSDLANATNSESFFDAVLPVANLPDDKIQKWNTLLGLLPVACILEDAGVASVEWDSTVTRRVDATKIFDEDTPIEKHRLYWKYFSLWTLIELGLTDFGYIPKVYPNLLLDLRDFIATSRREVAPCLREKDEWRFWMPPGLNADRGIILSASDAGDDISNVYEPTPISVTTLTGKPPQWEGGCQLYQISTGRYSLWQGLLKTGNKFKPQARRMVNLIEQTADAGVKCLVVAPIAFIQAAGTKKLREHPNVTLINHHHAEGRNDYQDCDIVFVFHYEPRPDVIEAQTKRIYRNATDLSFERELIDIVKDGVSLERERYVDPRVQAVFDRECSARLMQSILRLRQMMNPDKIAVVFTSEPIGGLPIAPIPFTLKDVERCFDGGGSWDGLEAFLTETDVKTVAERDGVSERTVYRKTVGSRKLNNAETKQQALALYSNGISLDEISAGFGGKPTARTIRRWVAELEF